MKNALVLTAAFLAASIADAAPGGTPRDADPELPGHLSCAAEDRRAGSEINIRNFNSADADWNLDGNLIDRKKKLGRYEISFSNECDNSYEFVFALRDLKRLAAGEVEQVKGDLVFAHSELRDPQGDGDVKPVHTQVTCSLSRQ